MDYIKRKIRLWLGLSNPDAFIGVDIGYRDWSALVLIKRIGGDRRAIVEIVNFPPDTPANEIEATIQGLQYRYGVRKEATFRDMPSNYPQRMS